MPSISFGVSIHRFHPDAVLGAFSSSDEQLRPQSMRRGMADALCRSWRDYTGQGRGGEGRAMRSSLSQASHDWSMPAHVDHAQGASWMGLPLLPQNTGSRAAQHQLPLPQGVKAGHPGAAGGFPAGGEDHPPVEPRKSLEDDRFRAFPAFVANPGGRASSFQPVSARPWSSWACPKGRSSYLISWRSGRNSGLHRATCVMDPLNCRRQSPAPCSAGHVEWEWPLSSREAEPSRAR